MAKTKQEIYEDAKRRGYCSSWQRGQFAQVGFDISMLKLTEEVRPQKKTKSKKGYADFMLDQIIGRF